MRRCKIIVLIALFLLGSVLAWTIGNARQGYKVVSEHSDFSLRGLWTFRGQEHEMWAVDPWELQLSRILGRSAITRRIRPLVCRPIPLFRAKTSGTTIGFIARFRGTISDKDMSELRATLFSGTNRYDLAFAASSRDLIRHSFMHCWTLDENPQPNEFVELRISFPSGRELARVMIPATRPEFSQPIYGGERRQKEFVSKTLQEFIRGEKTARKVLDELHRLYEEYNAPTFLTGFAMLYYEQDAPSAQSTSGVNEIATRLRSEAIEWLTTMNLASTPDNRPSSEERTSTETQ